MKKLGLLWMIPMLALNASAQDKPKADDAAAPASAKAPANGELRLNFRGAPLELVLDYLSEAAGFIIVLDTPVKGKVDMWSNQPVTKEEALNLLNSVLNKNGLAAIRNDRTLTIVDKKDAKSRDLPVKLGSDPIAIPRNDEIVTQIMPMRYVDATQLIRDIREVVSAQNMTANESGNSIIITDTQANIRRVAEITRAIDDGARADMTLKVFKLKNSNPAEMAELFSTLFPDGSQGRGSSRFGGFPFPFGGGSSRGGGGFPGFGDIGGGGGSGSTSERVKKGSKVVAVADARTSSLIVTASKDMMPSIEEMIKTLDNDPANRQKVSVFKLENANPQQVQTVLQDIFQKNTTSRSSANQTPSTLQNRSTQTQTTNSFGNGGFGNGNRGNNPFGQ